MCVLNLPSMQPILGPHLLATSFFPANVGPGTDSPWESR